MAHKELNGIAVAGTIQVERHPEPNGIGSAKLVCAGCVPNLTGMLKKLSGKMPVSAIGAVGDDAQGRFAVSWLKSAGIHTSDVKTIEGYTDDAPRSFGVSHMAFRDLSCKILHLGYFLTMDRIDSGDGRKILKHAKQCGMETSLSMRSGFSDRYAAVLAALPYTDYFSVSLEDAAWLVKMDPQTDGIEKIARRLLWYGVKKKVFIFSDQWVACCTKTQYDLLGNFILPDSNICGDAQLQDAFCAGVLTGVYNGWGNMKILEFASSCLAVKQCAEQMESVSDVQAYCEQFKRYKKGLSGEQ